MATSKTKKQTAPKGKKATIRTKMKDLKTTKKVTGGATKKPTTVPSPCQLN